MTDDQTAAAAAAAHQHDDHCRCRHRRRRRRGYGHCLMESFVILSSWAVCLVLAGGLFWLLMRWVTAHPPTTRPPPPSS